MRAGYSALVAVVATGFAVFGMMEYPRADDGSVKAKPEARVKIPAGDSPRENSAAVVGGVSNAALEVSRAFVQTAKDVRPAVVVIDTTVTDDDNGTPFFGGGQPRHGTGSGFFVDLQKGVILTNAHVVLGAKKVWVTTFDRRKYEGRVLGAEPSMDVAVIAIPGLRSEGLRALPWGDSDAVEVGEMVLALGAPFGLSQTLTHGIVSAVGRGDLPGPAPIGDLIQTDAPINPGNSGGPLLNLRGQVIGINTAITSPSGASAGVGFAVPARVAKMAGEMIAEHGKVTRGFLGMQGDDADVALAQLKLPFEVKGGALVTAVDPKGPAAQAGLRPYDVITDINGRSVANFAQLRSAVAFLKPGHAVTVTFFRDGEKKTAKVAIAEFPS